MKTLKVFFTVNGLNEGQLFTHNPPRPSTYMNVPAWIGGKHLMLRNSADWPDPKQTDKDGIKEYNMILIPSHKYPELSPETRAYFTNLNDEDRGSSGV